MEIKHSTIRAIAQATENNDHGEALDLAMTAMLSTYKPEIKKELQEARRQLAHIRRKHQRDGHLTVSLVHRRFQLYEQMLKIAKQQLPAPQYEKLHAAF
jgi:hypothetical protein